MRRKVNVISQLGNGLRNRQIAERPVVCENAVDYHVSAIRRNLGVRARR